MQAQVIIKINLRGIRNPHDVMEEAVNTIGRAGQSAVRMRRVKNNLTVTPFFLIIYIIIAFAQCF